jgi:hypothetical protein
MTDQELRAMVRDAVARELAARELSPGARPSGSAAGVPGPAAATFASVPLALVRQHPSHVMFALTAGAEVDGQCLIEPAVACNHCGYCKSYGC